MFIILGGTGHVGSAAADALLRRGEAVTIVTRDADGAAVWRDRGAEVAEADVNDVVSLREVFRRGRRALLVSPPADPATDTDAVERQSVANILAALEGSGLEKIVAQSTYGAQPGERIGDLSILWDFEEGLRDQSIPVAINRGAYYLSNWDAMVDVAKSSGILPTMLPADLTIPMVAPVDLGDAAADRLLSSVHDTGVVHVEGPARYSPTDVASAFAAGLGRPVSVSVIPREEWQKTFRELGFSQPAAESYARMTRISVDGGFETPHHPRRGATSLRAHVSEVVGRI